jgi:ligand-binding SRPBCC domain-containing protein
VALLVPSAGAPAPVTSALCTKTDKDRELRVKVSTTFSSSADKVWALVRKSDTLLFVTRGFLGFSGSHRFPTEWREGSTENTRLMFFGLIPAWKHSITFQEIDDSRRVLFTKEGGGLVPVWNHLIQVTPEQNETCSYTDDVEVKAGVLTLLVWLYANIFYRYRQFRWRLLLRRTPQHA